MNLQEAREMVEKLSEGNPASDTALAVVLLELITRLEQAETAKSAEVPKRRR